MIVGGGKGYRLLLWCLGATLFFSPVLPYVGVLVLGSIWSSLLFKSPFPFSSCWFRRSFTSSSLFSLLYPSPLIAPPLTLWAVGNSNMRIHLLSWGLLPLPPPPNPDRFSNLSGKGSLEIFLKNYVIMAISLIFLPCFVPKNIFSGSTSFVTESRSFIFEICRAGKWENTYTDKELNYYYYFFNPSWYNVFLKAFNTGVCDTSSKLVCL